MARSASIVNKPLDESSAESIVEKALSSLSADTRSRTEGRGSGARVTM
jgi:hypothetical protein